MRAAAAAMDYETAASLRDDLQAGTDLGQLVEKDLVQRQQLVFE